MLVLDFAFVFDSVLVFAALALGLVTSFFDLKLGLIKNWVIAGALFFAFAVNLTALFFGASGEAYFVFFVSNAFLSGVLAFFLWHAKVWSAGDAKLFSAFAALLPLSVFELRLWQPFPGLDLLVNVLVPFALVLFFVSLFKTDFAEKAGVFKRSFDLMLLFDVFLFAFALAGLRMFFSGFLGFDIGVGALGILAAFSFMAFRRAVERKVYFPVLLAVFFVRVVFGVLSNGFFGLVQEAFVLMFFSSGLALALGFVSRLSFFVFSSSIQISALSAGMRLAQTVVRNKTGKLALKEIGGKVPENSVLKLPQGALCEEDLVLLRKLKREGKLSANELPVLQVIPFAPIMFFGVLLSIAVKGNVLIFAKHILS